MAAHEPVHHRWRVEPGRHLDLSAIDTNSKAGAPGGKDKTAAASDALRDRLEELQLRLYGEARQSLLVVLQATDTGGKDGTIRKVFSQINPQGVRVQSFKAPTETELGHDFLWRIHPHVPAQGEIAIFNRSHYEDVLVVRVHDLIDDETAEARFEHIRAFEDLLRSQGTQVVKLFLHISRDEQRERLQARLDEPTKRWKFSEGDLAERERWDDYQRVFGDALARTTSHHAPWYAVPADRKWYRDWAVLEILVAHLEAMDPEYPEAPPGLDDVVIPE